MKIHKHIEIVRSSVRGLSSMSQVSCDAIFAALSTQYSKVGISIVDNQSDLDDVVALQPDMVFLGMSFVPSNPLLGIEDPDKIWLTEYLAAHDIASTGSGAGAHALQIDKHSAKQRILNHGLPTSRYHIYTKNQTPSAAAMTLRYPVFIKPTNRGGGYGIDANSLAHTFDQLQAKVLDLSSIACDSLVEEYLPGREFSVAVLKEAGKQGFLTMPLELIAPENDQGARFLSQAIKVSDTEQAIEITDAVVKAQVSDLALQAFLALGARDYGRIDIRFDAHGAPQFLEANLIPSLIKDYGNFPKACMINLGMDYQTMIHHIVELGLARSLSRLSDLIEFEEPLSSHQLASTPAL